MDVYSTTSTLLVTKELETEFSSNSYFNTAFMCILYLTLGTIAILANVFNIIIFMMNRELRANYIFLIILDIGEIVNGISYITTGIGRGTQLVLNRFNVPISTHDCFYTVSNGFVI